jgi:hypothetical protein
MHIIRRIWIVAFVVSALSCALPVSANEFQYAELVETRYTTRNGNSGILLGFSTDPGFPITVNEEHAVSARDVAYKKLGSSANQVGVLKG